MAQVIKTTRDRAQTDEKSPAEDEESMQDCDGDENLERSFEFAIAYILML